MSFPVRRVIEFIYSASVAYVLEFGELYVRVYFDDELITTVTTPYFAEHLFELQYRQLGDVMRIVHPQYKPRKLSRTSVTTFTLEEIDFTTGPFMTRNDLVNPLETNPSTMSCSSTTAGSYGALTCTAAIFTPQHVGSLFQLTHSRSTSTVSASGTTSSDSIYVKGSFRFITKGLWTGTVLVERNENAASWETYRTYKGSTGAEQNVQWTEIENSDNVQYRINSTSASATFSADLSCLDLFHSGIVRVISYSNSQNVACYVVSRVESTSATRRWAEGSWSDYRGWPASLTFFEDRCIYAGALSGSDRSEIDIPAYPELQGMPI